MTTLEQVEQNLRPFELLTEYEFAHLMKVRPLIEKQTAIACTACRYCVSHCPQKIAIPDVFKMYNEICRYSGENWKIKPSYIQLTKTTGKASACIGCKNCERHCPQHLPIAETMKLVSQKLES